MGDENLASINKCYVWKKSEEMDKFVCLDLEKEAEKGSFQTSYYFPDPGNEISAEDKETINDCLKELEDKGKLLIKTLKENFIIVYLAAGDEDNEDIATRWADKVRDMTDHGENTDFVIPIDGDFNNAKAMLEVKNEGEASTRKKSKAVKAVKAVEARSLHYIEYKFSRFVDDSILKTKQFIAFVNHKKRKTGDDVTNVDIYHIYPTFKALKSYPEKIELLKDLKWFEEKGKNLPGAIGASTYDIEHESGWQEGWTNKIVDEWEDFDEKSVNAVLKLYGIIQQ